MRASKGAALGVIGLLAAWGAGCLLPTGHVDLDAPMLCSSAGPGVSMSDCGGGARVSIGRESRVASGTMNAMMTVIAYRGDGSVAATWQGRARWLGPIPAAGVFAGSVNRGRVTWDGASAQEVRVETERDGSGGVPLRRWLMERAPGAVRVSVRVTRDGGGMPGAVAGGMRDSRMDAAAGGGGADARAGAGDGRRGGDTTRASTYRAGERGQTREQVTGRPRGDLYDGRPGGAAIDGGGRLTRGPARGGDGSHVTGTRGGSFSGSGNRSSWVDEPTAALSPRGARVPGPHGADGGSPAGTGKPGDRGLSVGMPVFGGVIVVPQSIAPALDVAAILWEAGVGPAALARKWLRRALRLGVRQLRREITEEAAEHAARAVAKTRDRLARSMDYRLLSAAEQRQILDAMDDAVRREYLARVEDGIAREIAELEQTLARTQAQNEVERYNERLLRENLEAARRVQVAFRQARAELRPAVASTSSRAPSVPSSSTTTRAGTAGGPRAGKRFTRKSKAEIDAANAQRHGGKNICENCGVRVVPGQRSQRGVRPPGNERQRDHIIPRSRGGDGDPSNGQVLCRDCNLEKSDRP